VNKALKHPEVSKSLASQALDPWLGTPEEFDARLKADYEKYANLVRLTGARIE
jgi:tripartite-type tricarboxylate transporter receptor subunit TctC